MHRLWNAGTLRTQLTMLTMLIWDDLFTLTLARQLLEIDRWLTVVGLVGYVVAGIALGIVWYTHLVGELPSMSIEQRMMRKLAGKHCHTGLLIYFGINALMLAVILLVFSDSVWIMAAYPATVTLSSCAHLAQKLCETLVPIAGLIIGHRLPLDAYTLIAA